MGRALAWVDLTPRDHDQGRRYVDLLFEQGAVDEMVRGTTRDAFA